MKHVAVIDKPSSARVCLGDGRWERRMKGGLYLAHRGGAVVSGWGLKLSHMLLVEICDAIVAEEVG